MRSSNSVCVSVRRGDFFNNQNARSFAVCTPDYYRKAKKKLEDKKLKDLIFLYFRMILIGVKRN
nr:alpha-1,2-fucosyltransferase [Lactobacillus amylovorus]